MAEMTDGMLYTDDDKTGALAFLGASLDTGGVWRSIIVGWFLPDFDALYTISDENGKTVKPPKPGECFAVELEL